MYLLKFSFAVIIGALSTGAALSVISYLLSLYGPSSGGNFISFSNPETLLAIVGAMVGVIIGGITGAVVFGFQLNFIKAILFGFIFYFLLGVALIMVTQETNREMWFGLLAFSTNGIITGAIISLIRTDLDIAK